MPQIVNLPDGSTATFPDEASVDQIKSALQKYHKPSANPETDKATAQTAIAASTSPAPSLLGSFGSAVKEKALSMIPRSVGDVAGFLTPVVPSIQQVITEAHMLKPQFENAKAQMTGEPLPHPEIQPKTFDQFNQDDWMRFGVSNAVDLANAFLLKKGIGKVGEPSASKIASPESVPQPEVRPSVGEGTPLRQQGEVTQTGQTSPQAQPTDQTVLKSAQGLTKEEADRISSLQSRLFNNEITQGQYEAEARQILGKGGEKVSEEEQKSVSQQQTTDVSPQSGVVQSGPGTATEPSGGQVPGENREINIGQGNKAGEQLGSPVNAQVLEEGGAGSPALPVSTGISNERLAQIYGPDAVIVNKGRGAQEWQQIGQSDKRDPYSVLSGSMQQGIATPKDVALFRAEHQRLVNQARNAYGTPQYSELAAVASNMANAIKKVAHGPASDVFRALQDADIPRYDSPADFDNIVRERMNRESTPEETATFKGISDELRNGDQEVIKTASDAQNRLKTYKPKDVISFDEAVNHIKQQIQELTTDCNL